MGAAAGGRKWAWMTGWVYLFALLATIASVAYGAGPFVSALFGFDATTMTVIICALVVIGLATAINFGGTRILGYAAIFGFAAELIGALAVGVWLLVTQRHHGLGVLFDSFGAEGEHSFLYAFLAASLIGVFQYYGFEACGDVAEEVKNPGIQIPKSMRRTIYVGGAAATFVCLSLILSVVDFGAVISGEDADPVGTILANAFGPTGSKIVIVVVLISFVSCALSLQAAASRLIYSYSRDRMIIGSSLWSRFDEKRHIPPYALVIAGLIPALLILGSAISADALIRLISFGAVGIYIAFQMVVLAALRARIKGWSPTGRYRLGRWALPVNICALAYGVAAIVNICWPRTPTAAWYDNYIVLILSIAVIGLGLLYMAVFRPQNNTSTPYGDAVTPERATEAHPASPERR